MRKQLHILEHPILHSKGTDELPVHIVWEPDEYASWTVDPDGTLRIYQASGRYATGAQPGSLIEVSDLAYILRPGAYLKAWEEFLPGSEPMTPAAPVAEDGLDFVIERTQPGRDGFSEDPMVITGEHVEVTRVDDVEAQRYTEPDDQKTQVIPPVEDKSQRKEYLIDTQSGTPVPIMRTATKMLDWGTLNQPLVVPENITFFEDDGANKE
jgi:hypothetical protein